VTSGQKVKNLSRQLLRGEWYLLITSELTNQSVRKALFTCVVYTKKFLDEVEHDIMNYQNRGLGYLPKPKAEADNSDTRF